MNFIFSLQEQIRCLNSHNSELRSQIEVLSSPTREHSNSPRTAAGEEGMRHSSSAMSEDGDSSESSSSSSSSMEETSAEATRHNTPARTIAAAPAGEGNGKGEPRDLICEQGEETRWEKVFLFNFGLYGTQPQRRFPSTSVCQSMHGIDITLPVYLGDPPLPSCRKTVLCVCLLRRRSENWMSRGQKLASPPPPRVLLAFNMGEIAVAEREGQDRKASRIRAVYGT